MRLGRQRLKNPDQVAENRDLLFTFNQIDITTLTLSKTHDITLLHNSTSTLTLSKHITNRFTHSETAKKLNGNAAKFEYFWSSTGRKVTNMDFGEAVGADTITKHGEHADGFVYIQYKML